MVVEFIFDVVFDGKNELESPIFIGCVVGSNNGIDLLTSYTAIANSTDMIVPFSVNLISAPKQAGKKAVLRGVVEMFGIEVIFAAGNPSPIFDGGGIKGKSELNVVEMSLVEFGIFIPIQGECVPLDAGEKIRFHADWHEHVEKDVAFPIIKISTIISVSDIGFAEADQISTCMNRVDIPIGKLVFLLRIQRTRNK